MVSGRNKSDRSMMTNYISQARKKYRPFLKEMGLLDSILPWQEILLYTVLDGKITLKESHEPKS